MKLKRILTGLAAAAVFAAAGLYGGTVCGGSSLDISAAADYDADHGDCLISAKTALTEDMTVTGDLYLEADLDLKGYTLKVRGDVIHTKGDLTVGSGRVVIDGDYCAANRTRNDGGGYTYSSGKGGIEMSDAAGSVDIGGGFITYSVGNNHILQKGTLTIGGDIVSYDNDLQYFGADHKTVFGGKSINNLYKRGTDIREVRYAKLSFSQLEVKSPEVTVSGYVSLGTLQSDFAIAPGEDFILLETDFNGHNITVTDDIRILGNISLNGGSLTVNGDLTQEGYSLKVEGGKVYVAGDCVIQKKIPDTTFEFNVDGANLFMQNENDEVTVDGCLYVNGVYQSWIAGTMTLGGGITVDVGELALFSGGTHKIILTGGVINNISGKNCVFKQFGTNGQSVTVNGLFGFYDLTSDLTIIPGENMRLWNISLDGHEVTVKGDLTMVGTVDLSGGKMTVEGSMNHTQGSIHGGKGYMHIKGDYIAAIKNADGTYSGAGAGLYLVDDDDVCVIDGDMVYYSTNSYFNRVNQGTVTVNGDIYVGCGLFLSTSSTCRLIFGGEKIVNLHDSYRMEFVTIETDHPITVSGLFGISKPTMDLTIIPDNLSFYLSNTNGHTLTIDGDFTHTSGGINIENGTLHIKGNYTSEQGRVGNNTVGGWLKMRNAEGTVIIDGDYNCNCAGGKEYNYLDKGTLMVGGNINVTNDGIQAGRDHTTVLTGTKPQSVTLSDNAYFATLRLTQPKSIYTFNREPCWTTLITVDEPHTHVFEGGWLSDKNGHWQLCECGEKSDAEKHAPGEWIIDRQPTASETGSKHKECTVCGYVTETEEIEKLTAVIVSPTITKTAAGDGKVTVSWEKVNGAVKYRMYSYRSGKFTVQATVDASVLSAVAAGLVNDTKYAFLVRAFDGTTWSSYTKADFAYGTPRSAAIAKPATVKATAGNLQATVVCSTVKGAKNYRLFYTVDNGKNYTKVGDTTTRKWVVTKLKAGVEYKFLVLASDGKKWSSYKKGECSAPVTPTLPNPANIKSTAGKNQATVVCSAVSGAKNYKLYYTADNGKTYTAVGNSTARKWVVKNLTAGKTYKFLVRVYDGKNWSAYTKGECYAAVVPLNGGAAVKESVMYITANGKTFTAELTDNSSAKALVELLKKGDVTIKAHDYGGFEKVGGLPEALPRNDEQITTSAGDLILYQGDQFVLYYDRNSWNFTRLGRIENVTTDQLKSVLGSGNVDLILSLSK